MNKLRHVVSSMKPGLLFFVCLTAAPFARAGEVSTDDLKVYRQSDLFGQVNIVGGAIAPVTNGAALLYYFSTNTTPVADDSGNGNTGTVSGATWTNAGKIGGGYSFNGSSSYIQASDSSSLDILGAFTICAWIKSATTSGLQAIVLKHNDLSDRAYGLYFNGRDLICQIASTNDTSHNYEFKTLNLLTTGTWMHVAATWDRTPNANGRIYVNGASQSVVNQTTQFSGTNINNSTQPLRVGAKSSGSWYFNGQIDDVRVFSRELSAGEVTHVFALGASSGNTNISLAVSAEATFSGTTTITRLVKQGDVEMGVYTNGP